MRGAPKKQSTMFSIKSPGDRVPKDHPLRRVKDLADGALAALSPTFAKMYSGTGRPSVPPEQLLKASLLMAFYSVRSERLFCEQLDYNLMFRWFLDMGIEDLSFDHSTFTANRDRLLEHDVAKQFFVAIVAEAQKGGLLSSEHFTVDGTFIESIASLKSFKKKDDTKKHEPPDDPGNANVDFHGEKRSNDTHESTTDPEARLAKKGRGKEAKLVFCGNALMENRNGLLVDFRIEPQDGHAERRGALAMLGDAVKGDRRITVAGDKGYDTKDFIEDLRELNVTPHVAQNQNARRSSAIDGRTTRHAGYTVSQRIRKRVEEIFGWMKTVGGFRRTRYRGLERTQMNGHLVGAAYNLLRIAKLQTA
jgi:transposase